METDNIEEKIFEMDVILFLNLSDFDFYYPTLSKSSILMHSKIVDFQCRKHGAFADFALQFLLTCFHLKHS